jgi:predicted  nucleic acid-binding Zn-ribbon protein
MASKNSETGVGRILVEIARVLVISTALLLGVVCLVFILVHATGELDSRHLTSDQKADAEDGIYAVDRIVLADDGDGPLQFNSPVQFAGGVQFGDGVAFGANGTLRLPTEFITTIDTIVTRSIELLPTGEPPLVNGTTVETLIDELIVFCQTQNVEVLETLLDQITTFIEGFAATVEGYDNRYDVYYADYLTRNTTFWDNEDRIATLNVTCSGNNTQVASFITQYNATEARLDLLIIAHGVNVFNYTTLLNRYNNASATINTLLGFNCSGLMDLDMTLRALQMDYNATVITLAGAEAECDDCAAALLNATARFETLLVYETTLNDSFTTLQSETIELGANTTALYTLANATFAQAVNLTSDLVALESDYQTLNASAAALQTNITGLRDLALLLNDSYTQLESETTVLQSELDAATLVVQATIANCTQTNATLIQNLLLDFQTLESNVTTTRTLVLGTLANTTLLDDLSALEQRITDVEAAIVVLNQRYVDALANYTTLNGTLAALQLEYDAILTSYGLLQTQYTTLLSQLTVLQSDFNTLNSTYTSVVADLDANALVITDHESRIAALEPDFGCNVTSTTPAPTPGFRFRAVAHEDMARGTAVSLTLAQGGSARNEQRVAPARGIKFQDSITVASLVSPTSTPRFAQLANTVVDNADFIYTLFSARDQAVEVANVTGARGGVVKLSPSKEGVWIAWGQVVAGATTSTLFFSDMSYNVQTDTLWLRTVPLFDFDSFELFDATDYTAPSISSNLVNCQFMLLELSRNGKWLHAEIVIHDTPVFQLESLITVSSEGVLCSSFVVGDLNQPLLFDNGATVAVGGLGGADSGIYTGCFCYDTVTRTLIAAQPFVPTAAQENGFYTVALDHMPTVVFDSGGILLVGFQYFVDDPITITLKDGSTKTTPPDAATAGGHYFLARIDPASCLLIWAEQIFSRDSPPVSPFALFALQAQGMLMIETLISNMAPLSYGTLANVLVTLPNNQDQVYFIAFSKNDGALLDFKSFNTDNTVLNTDIVGKYYYDERTDALHIALRLSIPAGTLEYGGESFSVDTAFDGIIFYRFDGGIDRLGYLTFVGIPNEGETDTLLGLAVNSHGTIYMFTGTEGRGPFESATGTAALQLQGLSHTLESSVVPGANTYSLTTFSQEDYWPIGVLASDVLEGQTADVFMRGSAVFATGLFGADDVGGVYHVDTVGGNTIARTRVGDRAQVGMKTDAVDEFLVDIHTTPLIGSDQ